MKKVFLSVLFAVLMLTTTLLGACGNKADYIVGYDNKFPPMGYYDPEKDKDVGFDLDLAKAVFEHLGHTVEFKPINWGLKESLLNSGAIDLIWNGYTITDARKEVVTFSTPYLKNTQCVVVLNDSTIHELSDIDVNTHKVVVQSGSSAIGAMFESPAFNGFINEDAEGNLSAVKNKTQMFENNTDALTAIGTKAAEIFVTDYVLAAHMTNTEGNAGKYRILEETIAEEQYGIGMRKTDTELIGKVNNALEALYQSGKVSEIAAKWSLSSAVILG